jgi:hypothetical protein
LSQVTIQALRLPAASNSTSSTAGRSASTAPRRAWQTRSSTENKIGLDVALESLKFWRERRGISVEPLLQQARVCRVERVMRPYLEAMI